VADGPPPVSGHTWASALEQAAAGSAPRRAFRFEGPDWAADLTFARWHEATLTVAAALAAEGVRAGERVALLSPGGPVWPVLQTACSHLGAVLVPVNVRYRQDELSFVLARAQPRVIVTVDRIREISYPGLIARSLPAGSSPSVVVVSRPDLPLDLPAGNSSWGRFYENGARSPVPARAGRPDDPVLLQFTSGTTAFPKGALLSSRATLLATWHLGRRMGVTAEDRFFSTQPFYHVGGSVATTLPPLVHGCTMIVPERYEATEVFRLIRTHRCTVRTGQAAMYAMELAHQDFDPADFMTVERGWAAGTPKLKQMIVERMGISGLISTYGLTETAGTCTAADYRDSLETRLHTNGPALPGMELAIAADGAVVSTPGVPGEVLVRGWALTSGYYTDPAATAAALDADGWLHTGDLGYLDKHGNLLIVDRLKDMIKPGGENVSAAEVERVIGDLPGVAQVAVVGIPDDRLGEVPAAFVEMAAGRQLDADAVIAHCRAAMASFKVPRRVIFTTDWPLTESGKIRKHVLREQLQQQEDGFVGKTG
jgi:acyl-CoA synthetase (AMP-forming)/AMP-acid ligase II